VIVDLDKTQAGSALNAQVCVVGAGAVGLALAVELAKAGVDVLVLEGGGASMEKGSQALQQGESVGHPFANIEVGRYRVLGGTTTLWGGQVLPFDDFVTGARPWVGHEAWPVAEDELARYFSQTYAHLGLGEALMSDEGVWRKLGVPSPDLGDGLDLVMTHWLRTRNFAKLFAREVRSKDGPRVVVHANVVGVQLSADGSVSALRARSLNGNSLEVRAQHFVLCNGTLEVVRLLKHPLVGGVAAPWADSPWLGTPLIDHLDCHAGEVKLLDAKRFHEWFDNIYLEGRKYYPKIRMSPEVQRDQGLVDIAAQFLYRTRFSDHLDYLKMFVRSVREGGGQVSPWALPAHVAAVAAATLPLAVRYFRDRRSFKPMDAEVNLAFYCEQLPSMRSQVRLADDVDALGMQRVRVDWQIDGRELRTMKVFGEQIQRQFKQLGLAEVKLDPRLQDEDPAFLAEVHDAVHQMGTARMGRTPQDGFVDADLRVFGTPNLYVAGAAVFPSTGFANPTFTAIALALRLGDHLKAAVARA
jgi:choline dehydrogenase-like flavoprotein